MAQSWKDSLYAGKQHYKEGNYERAYQTLLEAQKLAPDHVNLSRDIGNAAYRKGDYKTAEKAFQSAVSNESNKKVQSQQWHNVGNSQMKEKNYESAIQSYKKALYINPNDDKTRYNLAEAKRRLKQQKQNQSQNQDQKQNQKENQNQQKNNQKSVKSDDNKQDKSNKKEENNQQQSGGENKQSDQQPKGKLSDRKTDRMLEDLLKEEMQTKRKVNGVKSQTNQEHSKSGKRW